MMGFKSTNINPDVWLRPAVKPDSKQYYEYILVYVDDILSISINAKEVILEFADTKFKFKKNHIVPL
jgi:hypothetical protein